MTQDWPYVREECPYHVYQGSHWWSILVRYFEDGSRKAMVQMSCHSGEAFILEEELTRSVFVCTGCHRMVFRPADVMIVLKQVEEALKE